MTPYTNRLLIAPEKSESLLLSDHNKFQQVGKVLAIGKQPWYLFWKKSFFKVGDRIVFNVWGVDMVEIDGKEHYFVLEDSDFILGRYEVDS